MKSLIVRGVIGVAFAAGGVYVGYFATHPLNTVALSIAAALFLIGGLVADLDDVGAAIKQVVTLKGSWPTS